MKSFESLFAELSEKVVAQAPDSATVNAVNWLAAEHEGDEALAEEISQLLYQLQVLMLARQISLADVYRYL